MKVIIRNLLLVAMVLAASSVSAQVCGDVNGDGNMTIGDATMLISHISYGDGQPGEFFPDNADCDGHIGLTVGDVQAIFDYLFQMYDHRNCSPTGAYSFTPTDADTLFIPYLTSIPESMTQLTLTIKGSFSPATGALYLPLLIQGEATGGHFSNNGIAPDQFDHFIGAALPGSNPDTLNMFGMTFDQEALTGRHDLFNISYSRSEAGTGGLAPLPVERSPELAVAVERDGDLFAPLIVYYEATLPVPTLTASAESVSLAATTGESQGEMTAIDFTATEESINFSLAASEPWIVVDESPMETPATVVITADATLLNPGEYAGTINVTLVSPAHAVLGTTAIDVTLTVNARPPFSPGDINCDGDVTIGDISLLVDHVFINPRPVLPCE